MNQTQQTKWVGCVRITLLVCTLAAAQAGVEFNKEIRPILSENCFACHGPDKGSREAGLRLDREDDAKRDRGGYRVIDPGEPSASELLKRITSSDPDEIMPPPESGKKLTAAQVARIRQWLEEGAAWQAHWAYIPPKRPSIPPIADDQSAANPIDHFVIAQLERKGLAPSPEADRRTLIRRLSFDLTGLPPTVEDVEAFVSDRDEHAYEKLVDRFLGSPHFGERMAVPWLDLVRYADTVGYHGDQNQNIFPYREYVIRSFNKNKPFDQFTIEQLAGDLLPEPTREQLIATGFNRLNMMTREGGAQPKEYLAKYAADRVRAVSTAWMASTMACAECHDHKYDPFTAKDFYQLAAFFADLKEWGVYADYSYTPNPDLRGYNNDSPFPPEIEVESDYLKARITQLRSEVAAVVRQWASRGLQAPEEQAEFDTWRRDTLESLKFRESVWTRPAVLKVRSNKGTSAALQEDGTIVLSGAIQAADTHEVTVQMPPGRLATVRLDVLPHASHDGSVARDGRKAFSLSLGAVLRRADGQEHELKFYHASADRARTRYSMGLPIIGVLDSWQSVPEDFQSPHTANYWLAEPQRIRAGDVLVLQVRSSEIGAMRVATSALGWSPAIGALDPAELMTVLQKESASWTEAERERVHELFFLSTAPDPKLFEQCKQLQLAILECRDGRAWTMVTEAREPRPMRVLPRGNWQDESGELVSANVPHFLSAFPDEGERRTRLDLARWLVSRENPLTARAFVNRLWKMFFGTGLSSVLDDLGSQGEWPTHPELLDWLAVEFMESGWDVKHMVKLIVTSRTYRQGSEVSEELYRRDPYNRLLARQSPRRLPAEFVRDNALAVSGLIRLGIGGPSAKPYQPAGYYENLNFPKREYEPHRDARQYRRGLYMHWQRTFLHPMLANFDAPSREECTAERTLSNTPQQALTLLNDPSFTEAAVAMADRLIIELPHASAESRIVRLFQWALARDPKDAELGSLRTFLNSMREHHAAHPEDAEKLVGVGLFQPASNSNPVELAAWASVCRVMLNLHETITLY